MSVIVNGTVMIPALNGTLIDPDACTTAICSLDYAQLRYIPSKAGNLAYLIIFAAFLLAQLVLGPLYRTWGFLGGMFCGLVLEIIGYVGRLELHDNVFDFNFFVINLVCLTIGPACLSASIYLCLSRLVIVYGKNIARFSPKTYTLTFISCDLISLILQAAGGGVAATANDPSTQQSGVDIMIAGLAFQVASLALFMFLGLDFIVAAIRASPSQLNHHFSSLRRNTWFRLFPWAIALATIFIFIRCAYRVAELKDGFNGELANDEPLFMVFEGPMIMAAVLILTVFHPGLCFGGSNGWKDANWTWKDNSTESTQSFVKEHEMENTASSNQSSRSSSKEQETESTAV